MSIPKVSIRQVKAARSLLAWSQDQLADASGVSIPTIKRLEAEDGDLGGRANTGAKIVAALESAGVIFVDENGEGPGVRLRKTRAAEPKTSVAPYKATRLSAQGPAVNEWQGRATDDESAAHRLAQHLKSKIEQNVEGYGADDMVTLVRPNGDIVTVARAIELIERLKGWKAAIGPDPDLVE